MMPASVEFADVSYALAGFFNGPSARLLDSVSLHLEPGTVTAMLGRSGSGKTTLLRMVNALTLPTGGAVRVLGKATSAWEPIALRRRIGYVIQETGLFPHMTIERNVAMALELRGDSLEARQQKVKELLPMVGLEAAEFAQRYPWQLSGGQRQRVGFARALAGEPEILLMDEPFGALDPLTRAEMQTMLRGLLAGLQKTVLLVTHDLDEALYLVSRVVLMETGRVVADMPVGEVLRSENPAVQAYVRAFHRGEKAVQP